MRQVIAISHVNNNKTKTIQEQSSQGEKADDKKKDLKTHWAGGEKNLPYIIKDGCDKRWRGGRRLDKHGILVPILSHCLKLFCLGFDHIKVLSFPPFCQLFIMKKYFLFRIIFKFYHSVLFVSFSSWSNTFCLGFFVILFFWSPFSCCSSKTFLFRFWSCCSSLSSLSSTCSPMEFASSQDWLKWEDCDVSSEPYF